MVMPQEDVGLAWNRNRWMQYSIAPQAPIPMAKNASTSEPPVPCSKDWRAVHATSGSHIVGTIHQGVLVKFSIHSFSKNRKLIRCCGRYTHWLYLSPSCPTWATTGRSRFTSIASAPRAAHVFFSDAPSLRPSTSTRTSTTNRDTRRSVHVNSCRVYGSLPSTHSVHEPRDDSSRGAVVRRGRGQATNAVVIERVEECDRRDSVPVELIDGTARHGIEPLPPWECPSHDVSLRTSMTTTPPHPSTFPPTCRRSRSRSRSVAPLHKRQEQRTKNALRLSPTDVPTSSLLASSTMRTESKPCRSR